MSALVRTCSSWQRLALAEGWQLCGTGSRSVADPEALERSDPAWIEALVPGTVASSLAAAGLWSLEAPERRFDAEDWWYRVRFSAAAASAGERLALVFGGLATLAEVWLNGRVLLRSANMFQAHRCELGAQLQHENTLYLCFRSLDAWLRERRGRPRWRTPMVEQQQLRWVRTSLLGRTPGFSPPAAPVGPWRGVWLERRRLIDLQELRIAARAAGERGTLEVSCRLEGLGDAAVESVRLELSREERRHEVLLEPETAAGAAAGSRWRAALRLEPVERWWPHTHGMPALYEAQLQVRLRAGTRAAGEPVGIGLAPIGFRELALQREGGEFRFVVNGEPLFCRGACWLPPDPIGLQTSTEQYRAALAQVCSAGMNMLRIAGPGIYETERFLELCDAHGVLVWQDFMFAGMDYPSEDAQFRASVREEAVQQLERLQGHAALALLCGNSEVAQQAALSGAARRHWHSPLFEAELPEIARELCPGVPYLASSAEGGAFPHQPSAGASSYYGIGAYLRPLADARGSRLRFASECLAFANVPEPETLAALGGGAAPRVHEPRWKARVPRDARAGWDFDDIRDHYLRELFRLEPMPLRYVDHERYLRLARVASGEAMAIAFSDWRRAGSCCRGALVWWLRDLWPGAGFGLIDSQGREKAAYYLLRRALQPVAVLIGDEGLNGLELSVINERPARLEGRLELRRYRQSEEVGAPVALDVSLEAHRLQVVPATDLLEGFEDWSWAYRFGPPAFDLLVASLTAGAARVPLSQAFYFPSGLPGGVDPGLGLTATARAVEPGTYHLTIATRRFAQAVHVEAPGFEAEDQYFHLAPGASREIALRARPAHGPARLQASVQALNAPAACRVVEQP